jgi:hypothetical protein
MQSRSPDRKDGQRRKRVDVGMLTLGSGGTRSRGRQRLAHFRAVHGRLRHHDAGTSILRGPPSQGTSDE